MRLLSDDELLSRILEDHEEHVSRKTFDAFSEWIEAARPLTDKQKAWLYGVAERLGIQVAPSENIFSAMPPEKQREQLKRAKGILPWEK